MLNFILIANLQTALIEQRFSTPDIIEANSNIPEKFEHLSPRILRNYPPENDLLKFLPFHANSLMEFNKTIKRKIGILFLYEEKDLETFNHLIDCLFKNKDILQLLETHYVSYSALIESHEAQTVNYLFLMILKILRNNTYNIPCCLFMYNPLNLSEDNSKIIIAKLEGHFHEDSLFQSIYHCLTKHEVLKKGNYVNKSTASYIDTNSEFENQDDSHCNVIKKHIGEFTEFQQEEQNNIRRMKFEEDLIKIKKKQELDLLEKKQLDLHKARDFRIFQVKDLPVEPGADDKNSTHILFRFNGISRVERRFNRKDTIGDMYNFIESLDDDSVNKNAKFELFQAFPFALFNDKAKTLEEEKLFPNAVVYIRETKNIHQ